MTVGDPAIADPDPLVCPACHAEVPLYRRHAPPAALAMKPHLGIGGKQPCIGSGRTYYGTVNALNQQKAFRAVNDRHKEADSMMRHDYPQPCVAGTHYGCVLEHCPCPCHVPVGTECCSYRDHQYGVCDCDQHPYSRMHPMGYETNTSSTGADASNGGRQDSSTRRTVCQHRIDVADETGLRPEDHRRRSVHTLARQLHRAYGREVEYHHYVLMDDDFWHEVTYDSVADDGESPIKRDRAITVSNPIRPGTHDLIAALRKQSQRGMVQELWDILRELGGTE